MGSVEERQDMEEQQQLPPTFNFIEKSLKKVELEAKNCKYMKNTDNLEREFTHAFEEVRKGNNNAAWPPLRHCLDCYSSKLLIVTLDAITKLCAHGLFHDGYCDEVPLASGPSPVEQRVSFVDGEENVSALQVSSQTLAEDIITTVCSCKTEDEVVRLQLIRVRNILLPYYQQTMIDFSC